MSAPPLALVLTVAACHSPIETEFGMFQPPSYAMSDIGSFLEGENNFLTRYFQERGVFPTVLLYFPKISGESRESQGVHDHRNVAFQADIKANHSASINVPQQERKEATRK